MRSAFAGSADILSAVSAKREKPDADKMSALPASVDLTTNVGSQRNKITNNKISRPNTAGAAENANIQTGSLLKENPKRVMVASLLF